MASSSIINNSESSCVLTIAVCTYRRFNWLEKCLECLDNQSLDKGLYRIIVVDNSQLSTSQDVKDSLNGFTNLEYIITDKSGLSYARNVALEECQTPYIAYIDDDALADPEWAASIIKAFEGSSFSIGAVGGPVEPIWEEGPPPWIKDRLLQPLSIIDWGPDSRIVDGRVQWLVAANIAYRADVLRKVGGFPENLGRKKELLFCHEELYVHNALKDDGFFLFYSPNIRVEHLVQKDRTSVEWLIKEAFWERISREIVYRKIDSAVFSTKKVVASIEDTLNELISFVDVKEDTDSIVAALARFSEEGKIFAEKIVLESGIDPQSLANQIPSVYIVTPSLNAADTVDRTIQSVLSQQGDFFLRYHIQDGGSKDGTVEKLKDWKQRIDSGSFHPLCKRLSFSWVSDQDSGIYDAIIRGFELVPPDRDGSMAWINADDYLHNGAVANVVKLFCQQKDAQWVGGTTDVHDSSGAKLGCYPAVFPQKIICEGLCDRDHWQMIQQEGVFWRKNLWDKVGGLDRKLKFAGDWDLWRRFAQYVQLCMFPWPQGSFQQREGQMSSQWNNYKDEMNSIVSESDRIDALREIAQNPCSLSHIAVHAEAVSGTFTLKRIFLRPESIPNPARQFFKEMAPEVLFPAIQEQPVDRVVCKRGIGQEKDQTNADQLELKENGHLSSFYRRFKKSAWFFYYWIVIQNSRLFFSRYYLLENQDVAAEGLHPLAHYILHGAAEGRNPNPLFNTKWYLSKNPDVAKNSINPFSHYIRHGWKEGRDPGPDFSTKGYLEENLDVLRAGINPLRHFLFHGVIEGRKKNCL